MNIAFLDLETTGLDPKQHEILEFAALLRYEEHSHLIDVPVHCALEIDLARADAKALEINRYEERRDELDDLLVPHEEAALTIHDRLEGCLVVGNNVGFDLAFLREYLGAQPWFYQPLDLKAYAAGMTGKSVPVTTSFLSELAEVPLDKYGEQHTAMADAAWNRDIYDALLGRTA